MGKEKSLETPNQSEVTQLLHRWGSGDEAALQSVLPLVYRELHSLASAYMRRERPGHTLQPTALIHEAYLRLAGDPLDLTGRSHFVGIAARAMRQVLADHARGKGRIKRGDGAVQVALEDDLAISDQPIQALFAIHEALDELARIDERKSEVLTLRYFGGCTAEEIAEIKGISVPTVIRDQRFAMAWLRRYFTAEGDTVAE